MEHYTLLRITSKAPPSLQYSEIAGMGICECCTCCKHQIENTVIEANLTYVYTGICQEHIEINLSLLLLQSWLRWLWSWSLSWLPWLCPWSLSRLLWLWSWSLSRLLWRWSQSLSRLLGPRPQSLLKIHWTGSGVACCTGLALSVVTEWVDDYIIVMQTQLSQRTRYILTRTEELGINAKYVYITIVFIKRGENTPNWVENYSNECLQNISLSTVFSFQHVLGFVLLK